MNYCAFKKMVIHDVAMLHFCKLYEAHLACPQNHFDQLSNFGQPLAKNYNCFVLFSARHISLKV
jgi:diphthamide synthase subunit DPH2